MTRPFSFGPSSLVAFVMAVGAPLHAQPKADATAESGGASADEKRVRALALFDESVVLYDGGRFRDAAAKLEEAYSIYPEPVLLYNLARAYQESGELAKAIDAYERFLAADPSVKDRAGIEQRIVTLREQLRAAEADARVAAPPPASDSGARAVVPPPATVALASREERSPTIVPWIIAGTGAATIGVGAALGAVASSKHESAQNELVGADAEAEQDRAERYELAANVTLIAGGVITLVGAAWGFVDLTSSPSGSSGQGRIRKSVAIGPGSARFRLDF